MKASQVKYIQELIKRFCAENTKALRVPMATSCQLTIDEDCESVNQKAYRGLIGSILYLTESRRDISYVVGVCARFQSNPKKSHLDAAKRIVKYLKGIECQGIWYPRDGGLELIGYSDSDFGGCRIYRKNTSGT